MTKWLNRPMAQSPNLPMPQSTLDRRALARLLTGIENGRSEARSQLTRLHAGAGQAQIIGITGPPGCGKSTLVSALVRHLRAQPYPPQVAIVAVDPSSPFSGGAILGDRVRMRELSGDPGVFIRSMASRGALGGLASATADVVGVLDASGFGVIVVETVGAGQLEVDVARIAHTVVVVEAPGAGDEIQAVKAGILEIADIVVVNKADQAGAAQTVAALQAALDLGRPMAARNETRLTGLHAADTSHGAVAGHLPVGDDQWQVPVLKTSAVNEEGINTLAAAIREHAVYLRDSGEGQRRRARAVEQDVRARLGDALLRRALGAVSPEQYEAIIAAVVARSIHPGEAAEQLMRASWGQ